MKRTLFWYLRLATSVIGLTAYVLLTALWARSYTWADIIVGHVSATQIRIDSGAGFFAIQFSNGTLRPKWHRLHADHFVGDSSHTYATGFPNPNRTSKIWGHFEFSYKYCGLCVPYWFLLLAAAAFAVAPWVRRFSLRTLLIAMTLIAGLLGLAVASS